MKAVILAGGRGERLKPLTDSMPKPLVKISNRPLLEHQIENLRRDGFTDITLVLGYMSQAIIHYFGDGSRHGITINYYVERMPLGTAGALARLRDELPELFLVIYGDLMLDINFKRLVEYHSKHNGFCSIVVHPNDHPADSDIIVASRNGEVTAILPKGRPRKDSYSNLVNAGIMICSREILGSLSVDEPQDLEVHMLAPAIVDRKVYAYPTTEYIKDMGTPQRLAEVIRDVGSGLVAKRNLHRPQKAIFLDRDGTINDYVGLLTRPEQLSLTDNVYEAIRTINASDYLAIVISNQPVIARNLCTMEELDMIHRRLETMLGERGAYVDGLYFCPHHEHSGFPEENREYKKLCACRKPKTGMIEEAVRSYGIDIGSSYLIGDTTVDIKTGQNAGLTTILLATGEGGHDGKYDAIPDLRADTLLDAVHLILPQSAMAQ